MSCKENDIIMESIHEDLYEELGREPSDEEIILALQEREVIVDV